MADLSVTAANVKLVRGPTEQGVAGVAITAGQALYKEASSGKMKLSDNDNASAEVRAVAGIALHAAAVDQPIVFAKRGAVVDFGAIFTAGVDYFLSGTPGAICPRADVTTGDDPIRIGGATTTAQLALELNDPNVTL